MLQVTVDFRSRMVRGHGWFAYALTWLFHPVASGSILFTILWGLGKCASSPPVCGPHQPRPSRPCHHGRIILCLPNLWRGAVQKGEIGGEGESDVVGGMGGGGGLGQRRWARWRRCGAGRRRESGILFRKIALRQKILQGSSIKLTTMECLNSNKHTEAVATEVVGASVMAGHRSCQLHYCFEQLTTFLFAFFSIKSILSSIFIFIYQKKKSIILFSWENHCSVTPKNIYWFNFVKKKRAAKACSCFKISRSKFVITMKFQTY